MFSSHLLKISGQQFLEITPFTQINFRWRDLAETSGEAIAHDSQSLDSGAEGPDELDRPEHHSCPSGKSGVPVAYFTCCSGLTAVTACHKTKATQSTMGLFSGCTSFQVMYIDDCLFSEKTVTDAQLHYCISLSITASDGK